MEFSVDPVWSWPLLVLCCAAMIGILALGYPRRVRHLSTARQRVLLVARAGLAVLLLFLMLRPSIVLRSQDKSNSVIYILSDVSRSMQTEDGSGGVSRFAEQTELQSDIVALLNGLGESVEIRPREYADQLQIPDEPAAVPDGLTTSHSNALQALLDEAGSENVTAIIMLGDGRQAAVGESSRDPVPMSRRLGRRNMPLYGTIFGTTDVVSGGVDAAVADFNIPPDVFTGNIVPVTVHVTVVGAAGKLVRVRLLYESANRSTDQSGDMLPVPADDQNHTVVEFTPEQNVVDRLVEMQFVPPRNGDWKVGVQVDFLDGEARRTNNRIETIIRVQKGGIRVAYFDRHRPGIKWLRSVTDSSRIQLDYQALFPGRLKERNRFTDSWFQPGNYDAFIIGDLPADVFGKQRLDQLLRCCQAGAGLLMTGGTSNFGSGGYHEHPIGRLFPVNMAQSTEQLTGDVVMVPTRTGLRNPVLEIGPRELNEERWNELPPLAGATRLVPLDGSLARALAETQEGTPLLLAHETGESRVMAFGGDTTWNWYFHKPWGPEAYQRFWRQVIFWITKKDQDTDSPVWINALPRSVSAGQPVDLEFGVRDDQGRILPNAKFELTLTRPDGTSESLTPGSNGTHGTATFTETSAPGDYSVRVVANGQQKTTRFLVNARDPELDNPSADPELMRELAHHSGGDFLTADELRNRLASWAAGGLPGSEVDRAQRTNLWDNWFVLLTFTGLMTFEWAVRKRNGLV